MLNHRASARHVDGGLVLSFIRVPGRGRRSSESKCFGFGSTSSSRTSPSSTTGCGGGASTSTRGASRASRSRRHSRGSSGGRRATRAGAAARRLSLELVLTAHPTEATRRTVLAAHLRLDALLERARRSDAAAVRARRRSSAIAEEVTALWQTDEVRSQRPRVVDEIRHGLWFFEQSLLGRRPRAGRASSASGCPARRRRCGSAAGSAATRTATRARGPTTIEEALDRARAARARPLPREVRELAGASARRHARRCLAELRGRSPATSASSRRTPPDRRRTRTSRTGRKLSFVWHRLGDATRTARRRGAAAPTSTLIDAQPAREPRRTARRRRAWPRCGAASSSSASTWRSSTSALHARRARDAATARRRDVRGGRRAPASATARRRSTR